MKTLSNSVIVIALCFILIHTSNAQSPENISEEKLKVFGAWAGRWYGQGTLKDGPGEAKTTTVDEVIQPKLNGTILFMEGIGRSKKPGTNEDIVVHNALGILSYDAPSNSYKLKSYIQNGRSTDAWFNILGENNYQWGFEGKDFRIRYTIKIDPAQKTWNEIGEFSKDGNQWYKTFEMNLKKID